MTTTQPDACGQQRAGSPEMTCYLPVGHPAAHVARWPSGAARAAWIDQEAGTPATAGRVVTAADIRHLATHDLQVCDAERAAHEEHRLALSQALGLGTGAPWDAIIDRTQTVTAAATERADLLEEARDALEAAGQNGAHGDDWPAIAPAIRALAADLAAARAGDAPWIRAYREDLTDARQRAERAEATLTRVRDAVAEAKACGGEDAGCTVDHRDIITNLIDNGLTALGDDQPTPDAGTTVTSHTYEGDGGPCAADFYGQTCGAPRDDHDLIPDTEPELIPVLDYAIHRLFAAIRNALRARP